MARSLTLYAKLVLSHGPDQIAVVADGNYVIVNFPSQAALDRILARGSSGSKGGSPLQALAQVNELVRAMHMVLDIRVGGKPYVEFGSGSSARITAHAVLGKLASFFKR